MDSQVSVERGIVQEPILGHGEHAGSSLVQKTRMVFKKINERQRDPTRERGLVVFRC